MRRPDNGSNGNGNGNGHGHGHGHVDQPLARAQVSIQRCVNGDGSEQTDIEVECPRCRQTLMLDTRSPALARRLRRHGTPTDRPAGPGEPTVAEVMSREVVCVHVDTSVADVRRLLVDNKLGGAPVIDASGKPVGVVSKTDLVRDALDAADDEPVNPVLPRGQGLELGFHAERYPHSTVGEIMTPHPFTVLVDAPLARAAALMALEGVRRVVITNHDGHVAGLLSAFDIARWYAHAHWH